MSTLKISDAELERLLSEFNTKLETDDIPPITKDELISSVLLSRKLAWIPLVASLLGFAMLGFVMTQIPLNSYILYNGRGASNGHVYVHYAHHPDRTTRTRPRKPSPKERHIHPQQTST